MQEEEAQLFELPPCKFAYHDCVDSGHGNRVFANYTDEVNEAEPEAEPACVSTTNPSASTVNSSA